MGFNSRHFRARIDNPDFFTYDCRMKTGPGLRGALLVELKKSQRATAKYLASRLGVSLNAIRHHLRDLERDGLVEFERAHQGVGAPAFSYRLTERGIALFPRRYEGTLGDLLDHVVEKEGRDGAVAVLETRYLRQAEELTAQLAGVEPAQRLAAVARFLSDGGYMAEGAAGVHEGTLVEHNCAIQAVAERFPEICAAEARFLEAVLGGRVQRERHILAGCSACEYRVRFTAQSPSAEPISAGHPRGIEEKS
jgi:DeoR family suf operon transcriptional repressor